MVSAPLEENVRGPLRAAPPRWPAALAALIVAGCLTACVAAGGRNVSNAPGVGAEARAAIEDGIRLYEAGEYPMAARRFGEGAALADRMGDDGLLWRSVAAECTSWLLARQLREFDACSGRLEMAQRRAHETSGGTNALIALGAVAGGRSQPSVNVPGAVRRVVRPRPAPEDY